MNDTPHVRARIHDSTIKRITRIFTELLQNARRAGAPDVSVAVARPLTVIRDFRPMSDRYSFDVGPCSYANGFAQIDTRQDASYYGTWCAPATRTIVNYCEGDVTTTVCETDAEFVEQLRELARWNAEAGYGPMKIDAEFGDGLRQTFENLGVADLLH